MYGRGKSITWWLHGLSLINDGGQQLLLLKICAFANTCIWMPVKKKSKKLGQANSLNGKRWLDWLCHVRDNSGGKYFLALYLTQVLCIRISQALQLRVCDFNFRDRTVWIAPFKRHAAATKPLVPSAANTLQQIKVEGVKSKTQKNFCWPKKGYLFPSRKGSKQPYMSRYVMAHMIAKVRTSFLEKFAHKYPDLVAGKTIRSHSGRRHAITAYAESGLDPLIGMAYAQISSFRVYRSYVDIQPDSTRRKMSKLDQKAKLGRI